MRSRARALARSLAASPRTERAAAVRQRRRLDADRRSQIATGSRALTDAADAAVAAARLAADYAVGRCPPHLSQLSPASQTASPQVEPPPSHAGAPPLSLSSTQPSPSPLTARALDRPLEVRVARPQTNELDIATVQMTYALSCVRRGSLWISPHVGHRRFAPTSRRRSPAMMTPSRPKRGVLPRQDYAHSLPRRGDAATRRP